MTGETMFLVIERHEDAKCVCEVRKRCIEKKLSTVAISLKEEEDEKNKKKLSICTLNDVIYFLSQISKFLLNARFTSPYAENVYDKTCLMFLLIARSECMSLKKKKKRENCPRRSLFLVTE